MLQRDNREIVNTCDHLTTQLNEAACGGTVFRTRSARPKPVLHPCANVPNAFRLLTWWKYVGGNEFGMH
jgi:hypothetical protein